MHKNMQVSQTAGSHKQQGQTRRATKYKNRYCHRIALFESVPANQSKTNRQHVCHIAKQEHGDVGKPCAKNSTGVSHLSVTTGMRPARITDMKSNQRYKHQDRYNRNQYRHRFTQATLKQSDSSGCHLSFHRCFYFRISSQRLFQTGQRIAAHIASQRFEALRSIPVTTTCTG